MQRRAEIEAAFGPDSASVSHAEESPVEIAPVKTAPVETAPVETAPVVTAPVEEIRGDDGGGDESGGNEDAAFQVTLPRNVIRQIRVLAAEEGTTHRAIVLRSLRQAGLAVPDGADVDRRVLAAKRRQRA